MNPQSKHCAVDANTPHLRPMATQRSAPSCTRLRAFLSPDYAVQVVPLPAPIGGALLLSDNALIWLGHGARYALALNRDARCTPVPLRALQEPLRLSLRGASAAVLRGGGGALRVALSVATGELYLAFVEADGRRNSRSPVSLPFPPSATLTLACVPHHVVALLPWAAGQTSLR